MLVRLGFKKSPPQQGGSYLMGKNLTGPNVYKRTTFLKSGIHFTYEFVIPDIKTKQKYFF
jgi:hypothetical protein